MKIEQQISDLRLCALLALFLSGCGSNELPYRVEDVRADSTRYSLGNRYVFREFHLKDGTRCVSSQEGMVTCEWRAQEIER